MTQRAWTQLLEKYSASEAQYEGNVPPAATENEITSMLDAATREKLFVDSAYIKFLKIRNGASFNGLMLYGADIPKDDPYKRLDLIVMNQYHWDRGDATVLGTSDLDVYVAAAPRGPFRRLDRASWDVIDEFDTCDELLESIFAQQSEEDEDGSE
jgi:hypothetical protein